MRLVVLTSQSQPAYPVSGTLYSHGVSLERGTTKIDLCYDNELYFEHGMDDHPLSIGYRI